MKKNNLFFRVFCTAGALLLFFSLPGCGNEILPGTGIPAGSTSAFTSSAAAEPQTENHPIQREDPTDMTAETFVPDAFPLYGLCVKETCEAYASPAASADRAGVTAARYDVLRLQKTETEGWFKTEKDGKTGYFRAEDVRPFENLSEAKAYAAVVWARGIAADNDFHYGHNSWAHHYGCYFCGTNGRDSIKVRKGAAYEDQLKTYCCNPFVTAAFCHGAGAVREGFDITAVVNCKIDSCNINLANDPNKPLENTRCFAYIEKPASVFDLKPGDIILTPTHAMLVTENGMIAEASGGDDNVRNSEAWNNSIREKALSDAQWNRVTKVYRYIGV